MSMQAAMKGMVGSKVSRRDEFNRVLGQTSLSCVALRSCEKEFHTRIISVVPRFLLHQHTLFWEGGSVHRVSSSTSCIISKVKLSSHSSSTLEQRFRRLSDFSKLCLELKIRRSTSSIASYHIRGFQAVLLRHKSRRGR